MWYKRRFPIHSLVNEPDQSGFSGTTLPNQGDLISLLNSKGERADNPLTPKRGRQAREIKACHQSMIPISFATLRIGS